MTYDSVISKWRRNNWPREWRNGQALYNLLREARPDLADQLLGTEFDPFYDDDRLPAALAWLKEHWRTPPPEQPRAAPCLYPEKERLTKEAAKARVRSMNSRQVKGSLTYYLCPTGGHYHVGHDSVRSKRVALHRRTTG